MREAYSHPSKADGFSIGAFVRTDGPSFYSRQSAGEAKQPGQRPRQGIKNPSERG